MRYYGLYANAHLGKVKKASQVPFRFRMVEELRPIPSKGWAEMIRKVFYEIDPILCPRCGGKMRVISFLTDFSVVDRIINRLQLTFVADRPLPPQFAYQEVLVAAEKAGRIFFVILALWAFTIDGANSPPSWPPANH